MKYAKALVIMASFFLAACSDKYNQHYKNFSDFDITTLRNKSWFPSFILKDAYDLKNVSYLDPLCSFGLFSYSDDKSYDSIFNKLDKIELSKFEQKVMEHSKRKPDWFLNLKELSNIGCQIIKDDRFYILKNSSEKKIFFVLSN